MFIVKRGRRNSEINLIESASCKLINELKLSDRSFQISGQPILIVGFSYFFLLKNVNEIDMPRQKMASQNCLSTELW